VPSWEGKSKGSPLGYRIFVWVLRTMGVRPAYALLRVVAGYYFLVEPWVLYGFFRERIGYGHWKTVRHIYANYYQFGQSLIDKVVLMGGLPHRFTFDFEGEEHLHAMAAEGKGGLLLSAHIGNWEIAGHLLQRLKTRIHILMYDGEHERIKTYMQGVTGERQAHIILIREDLSHIYEISEALKNQELVCIHADRFVKGAKTMETTFMGGRALFPAGPFQLAVAYKVPVSFVFALKETPLHYHFFASRPRPYDFSDKQTALLALLGDFSTQMDKKVRQYPEQWYNYYNFWQT
jgi:predicted LPLAT superfamily acyltransferase